MVVDVANTFGALLAGGIIAAVFSGMVTAQTFAYFRYYGGDFLGFRVLVGIVWLLDVCHTIFVSVSLWDHLIAHFGDAARIDFVPWSLALTIAFTAILTFLVHLFFIYRIFKLSKGKVWLAAPLVLLACARLCFACLTTSKLILLRSLREFVRRYTFSFTSGLALSAIIDIIITGLLYILLTRNRNNNANLNAVLDSLILYTFENGSLTCAAAIISLICWLTAHGNLIFLGTHFVISKFYANSLLATLNARKTLHPTGHRSNQSNSADRNMPIMFNMHKKENSFSTSKTQDVHAAPVQISVKQTTLSVTDMPPPNRKPSTSSDSIDEDGSLNQIKIHNDV